MTNPVCSADEILLQVNQFIDRLGCDRKPEGLYAPVDYALSMGGKRIRPTLMLLGYNLFEDHPERILMQAAALETYHNYTLLHDDLMDHADLRRGHETVHRRWNANQAILSGDAMLVLAYQRHWKSARGSSSTSTSRRATTWARTSISK